MERIDYAKFVLTVESDLFAHLYALWLDTMAGDTPLSMIKGLKMTCLGERAPGKRMYILEAWGEIANRSRHLEWSTWCHHLRRLDVRSELRYATDETVKAVYDHLLVQTQRQNLTWFSSRPRSKRGGGATGGEGFALGSHKSDVRFVAYRKPGQPWACESQVTDNVLQRLVMQAGNAYDGTPQGSQMAWQILCGLVSTTGRQRASKFWPSHIAFFRDLINYHGPVDEDEDELPF